VKARFRGRGFSIVGGSSQRQQMVRVVIANIFRYLFYGAARNWVRNVGSIAPALGSMALLLLMCRRGRPGRPALYNLEQVEAGQARSCMCTCVTTPPTGRGRLLVPPRSGPRVASVTYVTRAEAFGEAQRFPAYLSWPTPAKATHSPPASMCS
jgi:hypothetical protein